MRHHLAATFLAPLLLVSACSGSDEPVEEEDDCSDGHCDVLEATKLKTCKTSSDFATTDGGLKCTPCGSVLGDQSGRGFIPSFLGNDALVRKVYMTFEDTNKNKKIDKEEITCPVSMIDIMAKLEKVDTKSCNGIQTRVVSETAAKLGESKADYRAVTSRDCDGRGAFGLLFSSFGFTGNPSAKGSGVHITDKDHPGEVEIIAFDKVDGVFNYYKEVGGKMNFFGSSADFAVAGPGGPSLTSTRGCGNCHPNGYLNMKELESPWTHWAQEDDIKGADKLVMNRSTYMGTLNSGADMQFGVTQAGNDQLAIAQAKFLSTVTTDKLKTARGKLRDDSMSSAEKADLVRRQLKNNLTATQKMLEPLFCNPQVNINNSGGQSAIPGHLMATNRNGLGVSGKSFSTTELNAALAAIGSTVPGVGGTELTTPFMSLEPSHEGESYINQLVALKVIDNQFVQDVLMVDFTRAVMSDDRCGLLALVPDLAPADRKADKIRDAIIEAIKKEAPAAGSAGATLLAHLEANKAGKPVKHTDTLQKYSTACEARDSKSMLRDALKLRSLHRQVAFNGDGNADNAAGAGVHPLAVFEFPQTLPVDNVRVVTNPAADSVTEVALGSRWNPNDCTLTTQYVAPK